MAEISFGIPPFVGVKFTIEEIRQFWKEINRRIKHKRRAKEFENVFGHYTRAQAESVLKILYREYFEREVDEVGLTEYAPMIENFGFTGISSVTHLLVQSDEMNQKIARDLAKLYQKHLNREPDPSGMVAYDKWIRFFGRLGREYAERLILNSDEYRNRK